jgi:3-methyladenine DNA glycosylase AlkD
MAGKHDSAGPPGNDATAHMLAEAAARALKRSHPALDRADAVALVEVLWHAPVFERRAAAVELLRAYDDRLEARDFDLIERLIRESRTWALVDALATNVAGPLVQRYAELNARPG